MLQIVLFVSLQKINEKPSNTCNDLSCVVCGALCASFVAACTSRENMKILDLLVQLLQLCYLFTLFWIPVTPLTVVMVDCLCVVYPL